MINPKLTPEEKQIIKDNLNTSLNTTGYLDDFFRQVISQNIETFNIIDYMLYKGVSVFSHLKNIPCESFARTCNNIETLYFNIEYLPDDTFAWCRHLTHVDIAPNTLYIGDEAFYNCESLKSINLISPLKSLGVDAFSYCKQLKAINLNNTVLDELQASTFYGCTNLNSVEFPKTLEYIQEFCFAHCKSLNKVDLSNTKVATIEGDAFKGCVGLQEVKLPKSIRYISSEAFQVCENIKFIELPYILEHQVKRIFSNSFNNGQDIEINYI